MNQIDSSRPRGFVDKNLEINAHKIKDHKLDDDDVSAISKSKLKSKDRFERL